MNNNKKKPVVKTVEKTNNQKVETVPTKIQGKQSKKENKRVKKAFKTLEQKPQPSIVVNVKTITPAPIKADADTKSSATTRWYTFILNWIKKIF